MLNYLFFSVPLSSNFKVTVITSFITYLDAPNIISVIVIIGAIINEAEEIKIIVTCI